MKLFPALTSLLALAIAPAIASAATTLVDFEHAWQFDAIDNTYAASGVTFTNVIGVSNDASFTYYSSAPSMLGVAQVQLDGVINTTSYMNVDAGVESAISFYYSTPAAVLGAVRAYSGLNGTGTLLGTLDLVANVVNVTPEGLPAYDNWTLTSFNFTGVAHSFDLTASANLVGLDNISVSAVPEPTGAGLVLAGLAPIVIGVVRRRRAQA
jgi:hypothetical protein